MHKMFTSPLMDSIILKVKNIYSMRKKKKQKQKEEEKKNAFNLIFSNSNGGDQCQPADAVVFIAYLVRNPRENISSGFLSFLTTDQRELSLYDSRWFHTCAEQQFISPSSTLIQGHILILIFHKKSMTLYFCILHFLRNQKAGINPYCFGQTLLKASHDLQTLGILIRYA